MWVLAVFSMVLLILEVFIVKPSLGLKVMFPNLKKEVGNGGGDVIEEMKTNSRYKS